MDADVAGLYNVAAQNFDLANQALPDVNRALQLMALGLDQLYRANQRTYWNAGNSNGDAWNLLNIAIQNFDAVIQSAGDTGGMLTSMILGLTQATRATRQFFE